MSGGTCSSSGFNRTGSVYCELSADGRARLWKTEPSGSGAGAAPFREYRPPLHLAAPLTSLAWIKLNFSEAPGLPKSQKFKNRKRKSSGSEKIDGAGDSADCLAFGTSDGRVLIYSPSSGKVEAEMGPAGGGSSAVRCIDWSDGAGLVTCSADNFVTEWNLSEATSSSSFDMTKRDKTLSAEKTNSIKLCPLKKNDRRKLLLTASCRIRLWCLTEKVVLKNIIGHSNDVCHLDYVYFEDSDKFYALSGSRNDRVLSFWSVVLPSEGRLNGEASDASNDSKKKRHRTKSQSASETEDSDGSAIMNPCCSFLMEDVPKRIGCETDSDGNKSIRLFAITRSGVGHYYVHTLNGLSSKPIKPTTTVQVACETSGGNVKPVPLICGTNQKKALVVGYSLDVGMTFETINPDLNEKNLILVRNAPQKSRNVAAKNSSENITKIKQGVESKVIYLANATEMESNELKRPLGGKQIDVPMESRLANLSLASTAGNKQLPDTKNMAHLLVQALHSKDTKFLKTVFECTDPEVAYNTVNKLPIQYVPQFLNHITSMLGGRTNMCKAVCVWGTALCQAKSSVLLGQTESTNALLVALGARRPTLPHLLALRARLSLTSKEKNVNAEDVTSNALLTYNDSSSEDEIDEDMEDAIINNEDDSASWNEDDDDEDDDNDDNSSKASDQNGSDQEMSE